MLQGTDSVSLSLTGSN